MLNTIIGKHMSNTFGEDIGPQISMFSGNKKFNKCESDWQIFDYDTITNLDMLKEYLLIEFGSIFELEIRVLLTKGKLNRSVSRYFLDQLIINARVPNMPYTYVPIKIDLSYIIRYDKDIYDKSIICNKARARINSKKDILNPSIKSLLRDLQTEIQEILK